MKRNLKAKFARLAKTLFALGAALLPAWQLHGGPYDFEPRSNRLGNADSFGYARLFRELGRLELADGRELSVHLVFDTDPRRAPGAFGPYWHLPLLRSTVARFGRYKLYWDGPDGARRFFMLDRSANGRPGEKVFAHQGREWRATLDRRGRITVESEERDGERDDFVAWEAGSGFITADSDADYAVRSRNWDPLHPESKESAVAPGLVHLERLPESGEPAVWGYNWKSGVRTYTDDATGEVFRNPYILAEGPANMKLRKREKRTEKGWELLERRSYDPF